MGLGERIKYFRKKKGMTIKDLSEKTNLSIGFISNLEREISSPTVSNLQQICQVLDINLMETLQVSSEQENIVHEDERKKIFSTADKKITFESLVKGKTELNGIAISIDENSEYSEMCWGHNYDELGVVARGVLEIEVDKQRHLLKEGDSIYINRFTTHKYKNPGKDKSISYWFSIRS